jgi:hypothetical protein
VQTPDAQVWVLTQALPHRPQLAVLTWMLVQVPLQSVSPALQAHAPVVQTCPGVQAAPHAPQFWLLVLRSTQLVPHSVAPPVHPAAQAPEEHTVPPLHTCRQAPQFVPSVCRLTQLPLQLV